MEHAAPAGQIETGALTEPQYRSQIAAALGLTPARPDPVCYLLACQALDLPPGQVAMVDDVPESIAAARAVGMHGVLHRTTQEPPRRSARSCSSDYGPGTSALSAIGSPAVTPVPGGKSGVVAAR